jgi:hypothetical protein
VVVVCSELSSSAAPKTISLAPAADLGEAGGFVVGSSDRGHRSCRPPRGGQRQVLGAGQADTMVSCGKLANAYRLVGNLGWAIPLLEQTLIR